MKKFFNAVNHKLALAACKKERGDTNFISILIILGIVILLAGAFIVFKDDILGQTEEIVNDFTIG